VTSEHGDAGRFVVRTTIIALLAAPVISLLTTDRAENKDAFYAKLQPAPVYKSQH
jgi:hypothetical protein